MSFLLDTNICSAFLRGKTSLTSRFIQYGGRLCVSTISLGELYVWAYKQNQPQMLLTQILDFCNIVRVISFKTQTAETFGRIRGEQMRIGISFNPLDLQIASTAIVHNLILVTSNTKDFIRIPGLQLDDWQ